MTEVKDIEFAWGTKKGIGGKTKSVQFYKSFTYDGEQYDLYDCVYLYKDGEAEPEIGKIVKIWETPQKQRKVKILWFFRPCEIIKFIGDEEILENELFLASGNGPGLADVNPLEAIAGKCNVMCMSKDKGNHQPSDEELQKADYVFYRTFDVAQQKVTDKIEGKIAEIDVEFLFNQMNIQKTASDLNVDLGKTEVCGDATTSNGTTVPSNQNSFKELMNSKTTGKIVDKGNLLSVEKRIFGERLNSSGVDKTDERQQDMSSLRTPLSLEVETAEDNVNLSKILSRKFEPEKKRSIKGIGASNDRPIKKAKHDTNEVSSDQRKSNERRQNEVEDIGNSRKGNVSLEHTQPEKAKMNALAPCKEPKCKINAKALSPNSSLDDERCKLQGVEDMIGKSPSRDMKPDVNVASSSDNKLPKSVHGDTKKKAREALSSGDSIIDDKRKAKDGKEPLVGDEDPKKKMKVGDKATNLSTGKMPRPSPRPLQNKTQKFDGYVLEVAQSSDAINVNGNGIKASSPIVLGVDDSLGKHKTSFTKMKYDVGAQKDSIMELSEVSPPRSQTRPQKLDGQVVEVTQRPNDERRKWFKEFPWQEKMLTAYEQRTLVLLRNLDPAYTSAEVEDVVCNGLGESCSAKMIQQTAYSSPYSGQAFVIFKTREVAEKIVRKLDEGCLLLSNGRPLVGSFATNSCSTEKKPHFFGHLVIGKLRHTMLYEREMKEAVSTSHFSQPNTIEYDMSMEWCTQQEKSELVWKNLYKQQWKEVKELKAKLKTR